MATKKFTRKEISEKNKKDEVLFVINNVVYDVTQFMEEHPGGQEVMLEQAGADATEAFDEVVGHELDARVLMEKFRIGEVVDQDRVAVKQRVSTIEETRKLNEGAGLFGSLKLPLLIALVAIFVYMYLL